MKLCKFWAQATRPLTVGGESKIAKCYGGSNESIEHALQVANERVQRIQQKIDGSPLDHSDDYEAEIREEIVQSLSDHSAITRNRYGALILNTTEVAILDIDGHPARTLTERFFGAPKEEQPLLRWRLEKMKRKGLLSALHSWRLYQTHSGYRLMLNKDCLSLRSPSFWQVIRTLQADWLYGALCEKQACYRARLTPKPYRMRIPTIRYRCPMPAEEAEQAKEWTEMYEEKSRAFAVCRLLHSEGSLLGKLSAVREHDHHCCRPGNLKLA